MTEFSILAAAREVPDRAALFVAGGPALTFREVAALAANGRGSEERVAAIVVGDRSRETLVTLYALMEARAPAVLVHPRLLPGERAALEAAVMPAFPGLSNSGGASQDDVLAVCFTSGTTGRPRGVILTHKNFAAAAAASASSLGWRPDDRWLLALPIAHVGGLSILTRCLGARRTVVVDPADSFDPARTLQIVRDYRVTLLSLVPAQLSRILDLGVPFPSHVRAVLVGGAAAPPGLLERARRLHVPALPTYGLTEACSQVATRSPTSVAAPAVGVIGPPLPGVELRIEKGRIQIRGPVVTPGCLPPDRAPFTEDGWLDTGDLGRLEPEGETLVVLGRADDLIVTGAEKVSPVEVEAVLATCPGIRAAHVFGVPDATWGEVVAAALVGQPEIRLADWFLQKLAPHRRPRLVAFLDDLPLTPAGKIDRVGTRALARARLAPP